jgi:H+/Cl- antiporter ClcA
LIAAVCFGWAARFYFLLCQILEELFTHLAPTMRPLAGGALLAIAFGGLGYTQFAGLGLDSIQLAFEQPATLWAAGAKIGFTALSVSAGFKGGEFIPMVYVGATLGSALASLLGTETYLAALGFGTVFAALSKTPLSCALMICELFGWQLLPFALLSTLTAQIVAGSVFVYKPHKALGSP